MHLVLTFCGVLYTAIKYSKLKLIVLGTSGVAGVAGASVPPNESGSSGA